MARSPAKSSRDSAVADAVQILIVAQEQLSAADGDRGIRSALVARDDVVGQELKLWLRGHHIRAVLLRHIVQLPVGQDRRRPYLARRRGEPLGVDELARGGVLAVDMAGAVTG